MTLSNNQFRIWRGATPQNYVIAVGDNDSFSASKLRERYGWDLPPSLHRLTFDESGHLLSALAEAPQNFADARCIPAPGAPYDRPPIIWGAGLNFRSHAGDLGVDQPTGMPGSYCRIAPAPVGHNGSVVLPRAATGITAEAELGLVIGKSCKDVHHSDAASVVAGFTAILDFTAEDVIRVNPRYIPWAKGFDDFFAFGPSVRLATSALWRTLPELQIATVHNGRLAASDIVANMLVSPSQLVEYFTAGRTLEPGTVICCGTPGAVRVTSGDIVQAQLSGFDCLTVQIR